MKNLNQIIISVALLMSVLSLETLASAYTETEEAIKALRPVIKERRAKRLSKVIIRYSKQEKLDPLLITSIIFRESGFARSVEFGRKVGRPPWKAVGLMQIVPYGAAHRGGNLCDLTNAECNIETGTVWLARMREDCPGSWWRWIAAYGMSTCPTEKRARSNKAARVARQLYCKIKEGCRLHWES